MVHAEEDQTIHDRFVSQIMEVLLADCGANSDFTDVWELLRPGEAGHTVTARMHRMTHREEASKEARVDRVLVSSTLTPVSASAWYVTGFRLKLCVLYTLFCARRGPLS